MQLIGWESFSGKWIKSSDERTKPRSWIGVHVGENRSGISDFFWNVLDEQMRMYLENKSVYTDCSVYLLDWILIVRSLFGVILRVVHWRKNVPPAGSVKPLSVLFWSPFIFIDIHGGRFRVSFRVSKKPRSYLKIIGNRGIDRSWPPNPINAPADRWNVQLNRNPILVQPCAIGLKYPIHVLIKSINHESL